MTERKPGGGDHRRKRSGHKTKPVSKRPTKRVKSSGGGKRGGGGERGKPPEKKDAPKESKPKYEVVPYEKPTTSEPWEFAHEHGPAEVDGHRAGRLDKLLSKGQEVMPSEVFTRTESLVKELQDAGVGAITTDRFGADAAYVQAALKDKDGWERATSILDDMKQSTLTDVMHVATSGRSMAQLKTLFAVGVLLREAHRGDAVSVLDIGDAPGKGSQQKKQHMEIALLGDCIATTAFARQISKGEKGGKLRDLLAKAGEQAELERDTLLQRLAGYAESRNIPRSVQGDVKNAEGVLTRISKELGLPVESEEDVENAPEPTPAIEIDLDDIEEPADPFDALPETESELAGPDDTFSPLVLTGGPLTPVSHEAVPEIVVEEDVSLSDDLIALVNDEGVLTGGWYVVDKEGEDDDVVSKAFREQRLAVLEGRRLHAEKGAYEQLAQDKLEGYRRDQTDLGALTLLHSVVDLYLDMPAGDDGILQDLQESEKEIGRYLSLLNYEIAREQNLRLGQGVRTAINEGYVTLAMYGPKFWRWVGERGQNDIRIVRSKLITIFSNAEGKVSMTKEDGAFLRELATRLESLTYREMGATTDADHMRPDWMHDQE